MRTLVIIFAFALMGASAIAGRGFNGSSDIIVANGISTPLDISSGPVSFSAWFYPTTALSGSLGEYDIMTHWQGFSSGAQLLVSLGGSETGTNQLYAWMGCCGGLSSYVQCGTLSANHWYNVFGYQNGTIFSITVTQAGVGQTCTNYVNYTEQRTAGGANFNIGGHNGTANFPGRIAEVGYWNVALSAGEQKALSTGVSPAKIRRSHLVGYWPLYGAGSPEPDYSGNKDNGTLTGTTIVPHCPCGFPQ
jgi:hypothetical protein